MASRNTAESLSPLINIAENLFSLVCLSVMEQKVVSFVLEIINKFISHPYAVGS